MIKKLICLIVFLNMIQSSICKAVSANISDDHERKDFIIVANSPISEGNSIEWEFVDEKRETHKIISLDGAANLFMRSGRTPNIILGDFDSIETPEVWGIKGTFSTISDDSCSYEGKDRVLIVPAKNQNFTDLEKAIMYCDKNDAKSVSIINAHGGRMDHELGNYSLLKKYYNADRPIHIRTSSQTLEFVKAESPTTIKVKGEKGDYCGIIGFPRGEIVTMRGFLYNANSYPLEMLDGSICNMLDKPVAEETVKGEVLIIHPNINNAYSKTQKAQLQPFVRCKFYQKTSPFSSKDMNLNVVKLLLRFLKNKF